MRKQSWLTIIWSLAVIAVAAWAINRGLQPSTASQTLLERVVFESAKVHDIVIQRAASTVHLQQQGKQWFLLSDAAASKQLANHDAVTHLLGDLSAMKVVRVVSHHAEYFSRLGLDEKKAAHVRLQDLAGHTLLDVWIGKPGSDLVSTYIRRQGSNESLAVDRSLTWQVRRLPEAWKAPEHSPTSAPSDPYSQQT